MHLPSFHPSHNFSCGIYPAERQRQIPSDLLETIPPEQLDGTGHAIQRYVLADKPVTDSGEHHSASNPKIGICVKFTKDLFKMIFRQRDISIDVSDESVAQPLRFAEPPIKSGNVVRNAVLQIALC